MAVIVIIIVVIIVVVVVVVIVPFDGSPLSELRAIVIPLAVYLYFITTVCIIFAVACSIVNFILRNRK